MGLGLLLMPALAGYFVQTRMHVFRYDTLRESGHHVFFRSALTGGVLALLAHALVYILDAHCRAVIVVVTQVFDFEYSATAIFSLILGAVIVPVGNVIFSRDNAAIKSARKRGELVNIVLEEAVGSGALVEILLENQRVHVGPIVEAGIGISQDFDFTMVPILTGYRKEDTDELVLARNLLPIIDQDPSLWDILGTTLSTSRIVSVRLSNIHDLPIEVFDPQDIESNESGS